MNEVLLAGDLTARDPGNDALVTAFTRELPQRRLTLLQAEAPETSGAPDEPRVVVLRDRRRLLAALRRCQVLVLGDGTLHGSRRGERTRDALTTGLLAKAMGRRVALLGVGAGALVRRPDRLRAASLVRLADLLVLRDPDNAQALAAAGAPGPFRVAADLAWCGLDFESPRTQERNGVLVILDSRGLDPRGPHPRRLAAALDLLARRGLRVRLAPWRVSRYGHDDLELARTVAAGMAARARVLLPPAGLLEAQHEVARAQVVITLRLQGLIVAASAGTPAVAITTQAELGNLSQRLGQATLAPGTTAEVMAATTLAALDGAPALTTAVRAEQGAARQAFRLLRLLLDAEHSHEDHDLAALPLMPDAVLARPGLLDPGAHRR